MSTSASPLAIESMKGCAMPAPAPCAKTKQVWAAGGRTLSALTWCLPSTVMAVVVAFARDTLGCYATRAIVRGRAPFVPR
jgi:hypothetical protein